MGSEIYVIVKTGYEGIDELCFATLNSEAAKQKLLDLRKGDPEHVDFYCIQKWDGQKFDCVCREFEVPPSKLMLR